MITGKPEVILHIGVEKTGTTTIQEFLHLNRKLLSNQGICFPRLINPRNHRQLAVFCCNDDKSNQFTRMSEIDDPEARKKWKHDFSIQFDKEMRKISGNYNSVIFSSEHISSQLKSDNEIHRLHNFLLKYGSSFTIILYIRRQDLIASSMISNAAKAGLNTTLPKGDKIFKKHFYDYDRLLNKWSSVFGREKIRLRIFETSELLDGDLLQDFMMQAGIRQDEKFKIPGRLNTSLSATAVEAAWLFNQKFPVDRSNIGPKKLRNLRMELTKTVNQKFPGSGKMLHKEDAVKFLKHYEASNRELARVWFHRDQLFSDDFSMYPDQEQTVDQELVKHLAEDFITRKKLFPVHE